jgi:thiamine-phosphate pyrophosphorylase
MKKVSRLHYITTTPLLAEQACSGGVDWVQLRLKNISYEAYREIALEAQAICKQYNATFIINDNVQLALEIGADGVHIGKEDMRPEEARALLGEGFIIGCTANTADDVIQLSAMPIDYIGLGPFRFTNTKEKLSPVMGLEGYKKVFASVQETSRDIPPVIAIGGITENDIAELMTTGVYGIAVSGAISNAADVSKAAGIFKESVENALSLNV